MKKMNLKAASAIAVGLSLSAALPTYAAAYEVSQADFDAAIGGTATKNITCVDTGSCAGEGDYTLTEDVNITAAHTGTIDYTFNLNGNSSLDLGGATFTGSISNSEEGANVTVSNGTVTGGDIKPNGAENFTLSDVTAEDATIVPTASTVNIESGNYTAMEDYNPVIDTSSWDSTGGNSTINITGGTFRAAGAGAPTIMAHNLDENSEITLNITGGTFVSDHFVAVDFNNFNDPDPEWGVMSGTLNANISGGTFTGSNAAISIDNTSLNNIQLSGGTYNYTDKTSDLSGAILSWDGKLSGITNLLADGYHFTNDNIITKEFDALDGTGTVALIIGDTAVVSDDSSTDEEASKTAGGLKAPDTGAFTHETETANTDGTLTLIAIIAMVMLGAFESKKLFSKR